MNKVDTNRTDVTRNNIKLLSHRNKVRFALFCAKQVAHVIEAPEAKECIKMVELWLVDKATADDCGCAADAAINAVRAVRADAAVRAAAYAAINAAYAAAYAAYTAYAADAANTATVAADAATNIKPAQERYLYELININSIVEQILLVETNNAS